MPRKPTRAEIRATNANLTTRCDKCSLEMTADINYGTFQNALTLKMSGGYNEFVDTIYPDSKEFEFTLCHKCAHKLMKTFFSQWEFTHWHPRTAEKFCDGWTYRDWSEE